MVTNALLDTAIEHIFSHASHAVGDVNGGQAKAVPEHIVSDVGYAIGDDDRD